jgi:hypothetical protein
MYFLVLELIQIVKNCGIEIGLEKSLKSCLDMGVEDVSMGPAAWRGADDAPKVGQLGSHP